MKGFSSLTMIWPFFLKPIPLILAKPFMESPLLFIRFAISTIVSSPSPIPMMSIKSFFNVSSGRIVEWIPPQTTGVLNLFFIHGERFTKRFGDKRKYKGNSDEDKNKRLTRDGNLPGSPDFEQLGGK